MDHRTFLSRLDEQKRLRLTERSDHAGLMHLAGHLGIIGVLALWVGTGAPLWPVAIVPLGIALTFLFTLEHEATHKTPFATGWLNECVGRVAGLVLILPFEWFRLFHMAHHRYTNDPLMDPELATPKPQTWVELLRYASGLPYWRNSVAVLVTNAFGQPQAHWLPQRALARLRREARVMIAVYAGALASLFLTDLLFWIWLLPVFLGQPVLRIYLLAEHGRCPPVADMFENSRTTLTGRIVRFLAWNMPYHAEHHAYPAVPFHKLPDLHREAAGHLKATSPGYAAFFRSYVQELG